MRGSLLSQQKLRFETEIAATRTTEQVVSKYPNQLRRGPSGVAAMTSALQWELIPYTTLKAFSISSWPRITANTNIKLAAFLKAPSLATHSAPVLTDHCSFEQTDAHCMHRSSGEAMPWSISEGTVQRKHNATFPAAIVLICTQFLMHTRYPRLQVSLTFAVI